MLDRLFVDYSTAKLRQLETRIATCLGLLSTEQLWARGGEHENAVGNLVLHLSGNVRQWIVSAVGGSPDGRRRDEEFAARAGAGTAELAGQLNAAVEQAIAVCESLTPQRLAERVVIQNYDVSVLEAVYHVVEHFSMHTGQILFATKLLTGSDLGFSHHLNAATHDRKTP